MKNQRWSVTSEKFLSTEQVQVLIQHLLNERDLGIARGNNTQSIKTFYMVRALLETGLRVFEFCSLINSDFHGHKISVRHGKGDKPRTILLTRSTANLIREWIELKSKLNFAIAPSGPLFPSRYHQHYSTRGVQKVIKTVFGHLGFQSHLSVHSLRHTYCSLLLASGQVSLATVKENMGHHSIAVTNLYSHSCSNMDDVELYQASSSENCEKDEPQSKVNKKKPNSFVKQFLRNTKLK